MFTRLLAATFAGGIVFFLLGFFVRGLIWYPMAMFPNTNKLGDLMNPAPELAQFIIANLVAALVLSYIFEALANIRTFASGAMAGAIISFIFALILQLIFMAFWNFYAHYKPLVADLVGSMVLGAVGGGVIARILGMMSKDPASDS